MNHPACDLWCRAEESLRAAEVVLAVSANSAATLAYYAAFYAVSALFAVDGTVFQKHTQVSAAVHRDLVQSGRWPAELGRLYVKLMEARATASYGGTEMVDRVGAEATLAGAARILKAVLALCPDLAAEPDA